MPPTSAPWRASPRSWSRSKTSSSSSTSPSWRRARRRRSAPWCEGTWSSSSAAGPSCSPRSATSARGGSSRALLHAAVEGLGHVHRGGGGVVVHHAPAAVGEPEDVGGQGYFHPHLVLVLDGDVLDAGDDADLPEDQDVDRSGGHLEPAGL